MSLERGVADGSGGSAELFAMRRGEFVGFAFAAWGRRDRAEGLLEGIEVVTHQYLTPCSTSVSIQNNMSRHMVALWKGN